MAKVFVLNQNEKQALAKKQTTGQPLSYSERGYVAQQMEEARQEGKRIALITKAENAKIIEAATPEHLRRPRNLAAETIAVYTAGNRYLTPELQRRLTTLREESAAREVEIASEMQAKQTAYEVANDPAVKRALDHWDLASKYAAPEDLQAWSELRELLRGGGTIIAPNYWRRAAELTDRAKQRDGDMLDQTGKELDVSYKKYCDSQAALARSQGQAAAAIAEEKRALGIS